MKTILVLTDFSIRADNAAHYALRLAQKIKANLLVCNVFHIPAAEPMAAQAGWTTENYDSFEENSINDLSELTGRLNKLLDKDLDDGSFRPSIEQLSLSGFVPDTLNEVVAGRHILMAVISMHGADGLSSFLLGNHTSEIIDNADYPVLLVPHQETFKGYKKIAFATDMVDSDIDILNSLSGFAKYLNAEILIAHVAEERSSGREENDLVKRFFKLVSSKINYPMIYFRAIQHKNVTAGLQWLSAHSDIDMLAVVHHKRSFFQRLFVGSVSQNLADHLTRPILIFPFLKEGESLPVF